MNRKHVQLRPDPRRHVVEHDKVGVRPGLGQVLGHGQFHFARGLERFFQKPVAARDEQHLYRLRQQAHDGSLVVRRQIVLCRETRAEHAVTRLRRQKNHRRGVRRRNRQRLGLQQLVVEPQFDFGLLLFRRVVRHAGEDGALAWILRVGSNVQRDDAEVVRALTDPMENQRQALVLDLAQAGRRAVAEQMNFRAGFVARQ